ncbi:MAG: hypothetical protein K9J30_13670, partial [Bacteroidales bacterium]|nr:hypothetical protein [Bacteroidales bacterium]
NLGLAIGSDVQAYDAGLTSIAGLTTAADQMLYTTGADAYATSSLTAAGRAILDDADASAQRSTLGLGTIAIQDANSVTITGGTIDGTTIGGTTPAAGSFTTLTASGNTSVTGAATFTTGAGQVTLGGNLDVASGVDVTGNITVTGTVDGRDIAADGTNQDAFQTLTGIGAGSTDLGTFTGTTITDNTTVKTALQELETALEAGGSTDDQTAAEVSFTAAGNIVATDVQAAIEELDAEKLALAGGTMSGAINMGTNAITNAGAITGTTITGNTLTDGTASISGGAITGVNAGITATGTMNLNVNSASATNINTGTSTGNISIGNASNSVILPAFSTAGIIHNDASGVLSSSLIVNADITDATIDLTTKVTGVLPVANGGTGASTHTAHGVLIGNGTGAVAATAAGTAGQVLQSSGAAADPSYSTATYPSSAGTAGNAMRSDGTNFVSVALNTAQSEVLSPNGTASTTGVMMGLAETLTPNNSGTCLIIISGDVQNNSNNNGASIQIRYGTGGTPLNGDALSGTPAGTQVQFSNTNQSGNPYPFTVNAIVPGLTLSTAHWIDLSLAVTGGTASIANISISVIEL